MKISDENPPGDDDVQHSPSSAPMPTQSVLVWLFLGLSLGLGLYYKNPAIALIGTMAVRLTWQQNPIAAASRYGKLALQTAIVMLGFTLGFEQLVDVSAEYGILVGGYVIGTLLLGWAITMLLAGVFRDNRVENQLLTGGTAICGGTTIAALAPILGAKPHQFAVATALVFILNAVALLTFPSIGHALQLDQDTFGAWVALAIHDTSSVVATAALYGDRAAEVATTVKLGRTLWLIPLVFAASLVFRQRDTKVRVPLFVMLFVLAAVIASFVPLGEAITGGISIASKYLLVIALGMIGLEIDRETLRAVSLKSVVFAVSLWAIVAPVSLWVLL